MILIMMLSIYLDGVEQTLHHEREQKIISDMDCAH